METMTPEQLAAWLRSHGGPAGGSGPDADGLMVQRAADGSSITVRFDGAGQVNTVVSKQEAAPPRQQQAPAAPAAAPAAAPSSGVGPATQAQLEARLGQLPGMVYQGQEMTSKTIQGVAGPKTVTAPVVTWINPATGQTLEAEVGEGGGSYTITQDGIIPSNKRAEPAASTAPPAPPKTEDVGGTRYVWQPNPGGAAAGGQWVAVGTAPLSPAERAEQDRSLPTQTVARETRGGNDYTVITIIPKPGQPGAPAIKFIDMQTGQEVPSLPPEPGKDTPSVVERNGKTYIRHVKTNPDGTPGEVYHTDQAGTRVDLPDDPTKAPLAGLEGMPQLDTSSAENAHKSYLGIFQWAVDQARQRPELIPRLKEIVEPYKAAAESAITEAQRGITNAQTTRSQDITARGQDVQDVNARRTLGSDVLGRAFSPTMLTAAGQMLPGNGMVAVEGLLAMVSMQDAYIKAHGLMSPLAAPPPAAGAILPGAPGGPAQLPGAASVGQPNALGLGAIGAVPAPGGPAPLPQPGALAQPGMGVTNTTDLGGVPRVYTPAQATVGSGQPPPQPQPQGGITINVGAQPQPAGPGGYTVAPDIWDGTPQQLPGGPSPAAGMVQQAAQGPPPIQAVMSKWDPDGDGLMDDLRQITGMRDDDVPGLMQGLAAG